MNYFINSRDIISLCDYKPSNIVSDITYIDENDYKNIKPNSKVYVITSALNDFINKIKFKDIILITGCSIISAPIEICKLHNINYYNLKQKIKLWYTQNNDFNILSIPLGLDFHTNPYPLKQENKLKNIMNKLPSILNRPLKCYANFHFRKFKRHDRDRHIAEYTLRNKSFIDFENYPINREQCWQKHANYSFVICPFGNGIDTHRLWETLILGSIPIIRNSTLNKLLIDLPVVIINKWEDLNIHLLRIKKIEIINNYKNYNFKKLTMNYWKSKLALCSAF